MKVQGVKKAVIINPEVGLALLSSLLRTPNRSLS
jgi:hypothetical protein